MATVLLILTRSCLFFCLQGSHNREGNGNRESKGKNRRRVSEALYARFPIQYYHTLKAPLGSPPVPPLSIKTFSRTPLRSCFSGSHISRFILTLVVGKFVWKQSPNLFIQTLFRTWKKLPFSTDSTLSNILRGVPHSPLLLPLPPTPPPPTRCMSLCVH